MSIRLLIAFSAVGIAITSPAPADGQTAGMKKTAEAWTPPLTPDGHPDLQGNWANKSATPLERPRQLEGRQFLTDSEVDELRRRAERIFKAGNSDAANGDNAFLAALANVEQFKNPNATGVTMFFDRWFDNRTSLIVDPPDGRIPPYTPAGQQRRAAEAAATVARNPPKGPEDLTNFQRCITFGVPMPLPGPFTTYYQIVQSRGYVVLVMEAIHDARIIALDGRPHLPPNVRAWNGDSVGHWEGQTLVADTTNFSPKSYFMGSAEDLHLVERFTRVASDEIRYEFTVSDVTTWTKPWTAVIRLKQTQDRLYEIACHEGNLPIMETMLSGARGQARIGEEAASKRSK